MTCSWPRLFCIKEPSQYEDTPSSNPRDRNMVGTLPSVLIPKSAMSKMTKVEYSVASDQERCIEEAIGILKKLSQHSPTVQEDIKDEKLKCIDSGTVRSNAKLYISNS